MTPVFVAKRHSFACIPLKELQWKTTSSMSNASVPAVDFVCAVISGIQMVHLCLATVRHAAHPGCDYHKLG